MRKNHRFLVSLLLLGFASCATAITAKFSPERPVIEPTETGAEMNFDLLVRNDESAPLTLSHVTVTYLDDRARTILQRELSGNGSAPSIETIANRRIEPGAEQLFFNPFPRIASRPLPMKIRVRLTFTGEADTTREIDIETTPSTRNAPIIDMPLAGRVLVWDGHDELAHHRRWNYSLPFLRGLGFVSNGMRYSYDFVRADESGKSDSLSLGAPVLAVADGTVVSVVERNPDDGSFDPQDSLKDINALCGNYVVIDLGNDTFALFAHVQQDSVVVEPGQRVRRGQVIARVGNSGSSMFPHLHFQLMDGPDMRAEGVPALFRDFVRVRGGENTHVRRGAIGTGDVVTTRDN